MRVRETKRYKDRIKNMLVAKDEQKRKKYEEEALAKTLSEATLVEVQVIEPIQIEELAEKMDKKIAHKPKSKSKS